MKSYSKRILVTGGAGFIGSHTVDALLANSCEVRVLDHMGQNSRNHLETFGDRVDFYKGDIQSIADCRSVVEGCDAVLHLAGIVSVPLSISNPLQDQKVNFEGSLNLLHQAREAGIKRFIFASSASVYGDFCETAHREIEPLCPLTPYAAAKASVENYLSACAHVYGMSIMALRYFNVYGERQDPNSSYSGVISRFVHGMRTGHILDIYGDGNQTRDFVYVKDIARANVKALLLEQQKPFEVVNIATGESRSLLETIRALESVLNLNAKLNHLPHRTGDIIHSRANVNVARDVLGYVPSTSLEEGLSDWLNPIHV